MRFQIVIFAHLAWYTHMRISVSCSRFLGSGLLLAVHGHEMDWSPKGIFTFAADVTFAYKHVYLNAVTFTDERASEILRCSHSLF